MRRERRIQRRIQDARFPMLKTLDAFSFEAQPDLDRDAVLQVFDCRFVAEAANIVFVGGVGTGKTHLSIALGMVRTRWEMAPCHGAPEDPVIGRRRRPARPAGPPPRAGPPAGPRPAGGPRPRCGRGAGRSLPVAAFAASMLTGPRSARPTTAQAFAAELGGVLNTTRVNRAGGDP